MPPLIRFAEAWLNIISICRPRDILPLPPYGAYVITSVLWWYFIMSRVYLCGKSGDIRSVVFSMFPTTNAHQATPVMPVNVSHIFIYYLLTL